MKGTREPALKAFKELVKKLGGVQQTYDYLKGKNSMTQTPDRNQLALLDDMRMQVVYTDKVTMPIQLYERMKAALTAQTVTDSQIKPYEGWQIIVDQQGVSHHVPSSELLSKMSDKYSAAGVVKVTDEK